MGDMKRDNKGQERIMDSQVDKQMENELGTVV